MAEVTNEFLARMIDSRFKATAAEFSAVNHRLDMLTTSVQEIAALRASHEEISVVHSELDRLRQTVTELRARVGHGTDRCREIAPAPQSRQTGPQRFEFIAQEAAGSALESVDYLGDGARRVGRDEEANVVGHHLHRVER